MVHKLCGSRQVYRTYIVIIWMRILLYLHMSSIAYIISIFLHIASSMHVKHYDEFYLWVSFKLFNRFLFSDEFQLCMNDSECLISNLCIVKLTSYSYTTALIEQTIESKCYYCCLLVKCLGIISNVLTVKARHLLM